MILSDGSVHPGSDPVTHEPLDIISGFQVAGDPDSELLTRVAMNACPGQGSCAGMFTYNTMQTFIGVLGLEPLHMISPASDDPRRVKEFPGQLVDCLIAMADKGVRPRDIVTPASLRNAMTVIPVKGVAGVKEGTGTVFCHTTAPPAGSSTSTVTVPENT